MLRILLLGTPVVFLDEKPVQIQRKLQRVLLYYLACQPGQISRSEIALIFWPDAAEEVARRRLREALSKLRAELPDPHLLISDNQSVSLDHSQVWVDVIELQTISRRLWNQMRLIPPNTPLPDAMAAELQQMVRLWRGDHFIAGVNLPRSDMLDRWMSDLSQELDYFRQQILERLGYHMAAAGNLEGGVYYLRQALKNDEQNETLHLQILTWLDESGKHSDAVSYCQYLKSAYSTRTGFSLPPGLERLCQKIQSGGAASYQAPSQAWPVFPDLNIPFVGRADLLKKLQWAFQRGGTVVVYGETGAGKTRLVRQLFLSLQPEPRLLLAPAHSAERNLPFQPIIEMLRNSILQEEWRRLPAVWADPLTCILPELLSLRRDLQTPAVDSSIARSRIFEALHQLLLMVTRNRRALFFLDDAHWSDEATLSALAYLQNQQFFGRHGLLVLAVRPEEPAAELQEFLDRTQRQTPLERFQLTELRAEDVNELFRFILGQNPSPRLVDRLIKDTGGNPLFLLETLRALLDTISDPAKINRIEEIPIASSISSLVRARLRGLSSRSRQTLETAAVIGASFAPEIIEYVLNTSPEQTAADLDELESLNLIRPNRLAETFVSYSFIHEVFREVLLRDLTPARRRLLHLRAAQGLEALPSFKNEGSSAVLADHYQAAGQPARACQYWIQAAEYARRLFSPTEALAAYHSAENLLRLERAGISEECILRIYCGLAEIAYETGDLSEMQNDYAIMQRYGEQRGSALLIGSAFSGLALGYMVKGEMNAALEEVDDAVRLLTMVDNNQEMMKAHYRRGSILHILLRIQEATREYQHVLELGHGLFDPPANRITAMALDGLAILTTAAGWPRKSLDYCTHSLRHSRVPAYASDQSRTYAAMASAHYWLGEYTLAVESSLKGLEQAQTNKRWRFAGQLHMVAARAYMAQGNFDESYRHIARLSENSRRFGYVDMLGDSLCAWGDVLLVFNKLPEAALAYQSAMEEASQNLYIAIYSQFNLGLIQGLQGDIENGLANIDQVIAFAIEHEHGRVLVPARISRAVLLARKGCTDQAREVIDWCLNEARVRELATGEMVSLMQLSTLELVRQDPAAALTYAESAVKKAASTGNRVYELTGLRQVIAALRALAADTAPRVERAGEILNEMSRLAQSEAIRPHFDQFARQQKEFLFG